MLFAQPNMKECIEICWSCRSICQEVLFHHCLKTGGRHVEQRHVRIMADCIQICQTAADFMTRGSDLHGEACRTCAEVCEICADSCDDLDGEEMRRCADVCRNCARSCRDMSGDKLGIKRPYEQESQSPQVM